MRLDLPTMMWVMVVANLTLALALLFVERTERSSAGLGEWGWALVLHAASYPAYALRLAGLPLVSLLLVNVTTAASFALLAQALLRFDRDGRLGWRGWGTWLPVLVTALLAWWLRAAPLARLAAITAVLAWQACLLGWLAWRPGLPGPRERGRELVSLGALLLVQMVVARAFTLGNGTRLDAALLIPEGVMVVTYLFLAASMLLATMGFVLMHKERAILRQLQEATHDPLTGAGNRRALDQVLAREIARASRHAQPLSLLMLDIDWFKKVNDTWGHQVGDEVLRALVAHVQQRLRRQDFLARFGGEEFVVLLPDTPLDGARAVAEDICRTLAEAPLWAGDVAVPITVSAGVGATTPDGVEGAADRLVGAADNALYRAKANGRNRVEVQA